MGRTSETELAAARRSRALSARARLGSHTPMAAKRSAAKHRTKTQGTGKSQLAGAHVPAPSNAPVARVSGSASAAQVRRLLWRAGFGPARGEVEKLTGKPIETIVHRLTRPAGKAVLHGPAPTNAKGAPLAPLVNWGEDHCWWLDRMVRSSHQLVERMTYIWHDWFATSNDMVGSTALMLAQNETMRRLALGGFGELFEAITIDPAMLVFLNGIENSARNPNENYAREMMELFSLGADRGAYTEHDVREMARALTGWSAKWTATGFGAFQFDRTLHDKKSKTVFGHRGNFSYRDAVRLCVSHPLHASFFVTKLWGYFIPTPPDRSTLAALQGLYVRSGHKIRPVLEAILLHPDFHHGEELVIPPVVYNVGLLRAIGRGIDTTDWAWLDSSAGQQLFYPPNVSGWNFDAWLDTTTLAARWDIVNWVGAKHYPNPWGNTKPPYSPTETPEQALRKALRHWNNPTLSAPTMRMIEAFARGSVSADKEKWQLSPFRAMRQNALRMLIAMAPDSHVS
jgi:uncharacterized protein (DUF1800 family)